MRGAILLIIALVAGLIPLAAGGSSEPVIQFSDGTILLNSSAGPAVYEVPTRIISSSPKTVIYTELVVERGILRLGIYNDGWAVGPVKIGDNEAVIGDEIVPLMTSALVRAEIVIYRDWAAFIKLIDYYRDEYYSIKLPITKNLEGSKLRFEANGVAYVMKVQANDVALFSAYQDMEKMIDYPIISSNRISTQIIENGVIKAEASNEAMKIWYIGDEGDKCWGIFNASKHPGERIITGIGYIGDLLLGWARYTPGEDYVGVAKYVLGETCRAVEAREVEATTSLAIAGSIERVLPLANSVVVLGSNRVVFIDLVTGESKHTDGPGTLVGYGPSGVLILSTDKITYYTPTGDAVWSRDVEYIPSAIVLSDSAAITFGDTLTIVSKNSEETNVTLGTEIIGLAWDGHHIAAATSDSLVFLDTSGGIVGEVEYSGEYVGMGPGKGYITLVLSESNNTYTCVSLARASPSGVEMINEYYDVYKGYEKYRYLSADAGWGKAVIRVGYNYANYRIYLTNKYRKLLSIQTSRWVQGIEILSPTVSGIYLVPLDSFLMMSPEPSLITMGLRPDPGSHPMMWAYDGKAYVLVSRNQQNVITVRLASIDNEGRVGMRVENITIPDWQQGQMSAITRLSGGGETVAYVMNYYNGTVRYGLLDRFEQVYNLGLPRLGRDSAYVKHVTGLGDMVLMQVNYITNNTYGDIKLVIGDADGLESVTSLEEIMKDYFSERFTINWSRFRLRLEVDSIKPAPDLHKAIIIGRARLITDAPYTAISVKASFLLVLDSKGDILAKHIYLGDTLQAFWVDDSTIVTMKSRMGSVSIANINLKAGERVLYTFSGSIPSHTIWAGKYGAMIICELSDSPFNEGRIIGSDGAMRLVRWDDSYYDVAKTALSIVTIVGTVDGFFVIMESPSSTTSAYVKVGDWERYYDYSLVNDAFRLECPKGLNITSKLRLYNQSDESIVDVACGQVLTPKFADLGKIELPSPVIGTYTQQFHILPKDWDKLFTHIQEDHVTWFATGIQCLKPDNLHKDEAVQYYLDDELVATYLSEDVTGVEPRLCVYLEPGNHTIVAYKWAEAVRPNAKQVWHVSVLPTEAQLEVITKSEESTTTTSTTTTMMTATTSTPAIPSEETPKSPYLIIAALTVAIIIGLIALKVLKRKRKENRNKASDNQ